ncbi:hypothetical protein KKB18_12000, partial [bacterium]|nr:hypothetical protein [bacterium]
WKKKIFFWLGGYIKWLFDFKSRRKSKNTLIHIMFLVVDHFEPGTKGADKEIADKRFNAWFTKYPELAQKHRDNYGKFPQHIFFFPPHYHSHEYMSKLSELAYRGFGEVEFHLHHDEDTSVSLTRKINETLDLYSRFGALITAEKEPRKKYGFIHGNWALDNSRGGKYCGVNDELIVLKNTGCYADFTMPSLHESQSKKINNIYYAIDDPYKSKSYNKGVDVEVGKNPTGDLMLIEGPLAFNWKDWRHIFYPSIENSEITIDNPPSKKRIDHWVKCAIHVRGKPEWIFIKVHCHGAPKKDHYTLLDKPSDEMFGYLETKYNDGKKFKLHYISAREAYNIIKAAEVGEKGDPDDYKDYLIQPYSNLLIKTNSKYTLKTWNTDEFILENIDNEDIRHFEFKEKVIKNIKARIKYISFYQNKVDGVARLKLCGVGKGEVMFITPSEITRIQNAKIGDCVRGEDFISTSVQFELINNEVEILIEWGKGER